MRRWVVTGPIAAGKSSVTRLLAERGAVVIDGDHLGHEVLDSAEVRQDIVAVFGEGMVRDGVVDRAALGARVFADPVEMERLNEITHERLSRLASERLLALEAAGGCPLAVFEAAVYFLLPNPPRADLVIAVVAGADRRVGRLVGRGDLTPEEARARVDAQAHMADAWRRADIVIENDGDAEALAAAVDVLWNREQA